MTEKRLIRIANSIEVSYAELARIIMREKFKARLAGNNNLALALDTEEKKIRSCLTEARDLVFRVKLSDEYIGELLSDLEQEAKAARDAIKQMRKLEDVLGTAKKVTDLAASVTKTLKRFLPT